MAYILSAIVFLTTIIPPIHLQEQAEHRNFQYNSPVDPLTGRYNFAYDTGNDNDIAHSLHMQYQDADGIVRGRYGYTDPRGKLRMVEYEAGPDGFIARGDVGPDQFPHGEAPAAPTSVGDTNPSSLSSYNAIEPGGDFDLDPAPVQMAGWNPVEYPMGNRVQRDSTSSSDEDLDFGTESPSLLQPEYTSLNVTSTDALTLYGPELRFYRSPMTEPYVLNGSVESENSSNQDTADGTQFQRIEESNSLNVNSIDVNPDEIRVAQRLPVRRAADGSSRATSDISRSGSGYSNVRVPYSYRNYYPRNYHDHDAEKRSRQTHDHDAERSYRYRQTHDHDAERSYRYRQTHDHDAERYRNYDRDAQRTAYYKRLYNNRRYDYPRRIFYRDSHSMEPHEHYDNPVYRNYRDHQHADVHLYGRSRNYVYPATAAPRQLKYIPADKYHDKRYYWTSS